MRLDLGLHPGSRWGGLSAPSWMVGQVTRRLLGTGHVKMHQGHRPGEEMSCGPEEGGGSSVM